MSPTPVLETPRLSVVPFREKHLTPRYVGWLNDVEVVRYSEQRHRSHSIETCREYWRSFEKSPNHLWAILARDPSLGHLGNISAHVDETNRVADVGILIGERSAWGKGYGLEAWRAVCTWLLGPGRMRKVTAGTMASNTAMLRIMQRTGMKEDGYRRRQYLLNDTEMDLVYMALFAEDAVLDTNK